MIQDKDLFISLRELLYNKEEYKFLTLFDENQNINKYGLLKIAAHNGCLNCVKRLIPLVPNYQDMKNYTAWTNHKHIEEYLENLVYVEDMKTLEFLEKINNLEYLECIE